jgi:predicted RNA-binding protein with PUA-like domain
MAHWLMKSEPQKYGFDKLILEGKTRWDGVRNHQAAIYLREMKLGDEAFFYHSVQDLAIMGIMQVVGEHYIDPSDEKARFPCVDVAPVRWLKTRVTLAAMKANPKLAELKLFKQFRLSIVPIGDDEWAELLAMGGE